MVEYARIAIPLLAIASLAAVVKGMSLLEWSLTMVLVAAVSLGFLAAKAFGSATHRNRHGD